MFVRKTQCFLLALLVGFVAAMPATSLAGVRSEDHGFPTPELKAFHDVLHPLVHEAAPNRDVARIRAAAPDLDAQRSAVLRAGTGSATGKQKLDVVRLLEGLNSSVTKLVQASKKQANDDEVLAALEAVHQAFEALAAGWPK